MPSMISRGGGGGGGWREPFNHASTITWQRLIQLFPRELQNNCDAAELTAFSEMHGIPCSFSVSFDSNKFNVSLSLIFKFQSHHHQHHGHQEHRASSLLMPLVFAICYLFTALRCSALIWFTHWLTQPVRLPLSNNLHHEKQYQGKTVLFPFPHRRQR